MGANEVAMGITEQGAQSIRAMVVSVPVLGATIQGGAAVGGLDDFSQDRLPRRAVGAGCDGIFYFGPSEWALPRIQLESGRSLVGSRIYRTAGQAGPAAGESDFWRKNPCELGARRLGWEPEDSHSERNRNERS